MTNINSISNKDLIVVLAELQKKLNDLLSDKLKKIILYDYYARGVYDCESDVDVLVIIDDVNLRRYSSSLSNIELELFDKYDLLLSILPENETYFSDKSNQLPFFRNVNEEGVLVYG